MDVRVSVENTGGDPAKDFMIEMIDDNTFSLIDEANRIRKISSLISGGNYAIKYKYTVKVDEDAVEGTKKLKLRFKYNNHEWTTIELNIDIQSSDAIVWIKEVKTEPEIVAHGEKAILKFTLKNIADSLLKDVSIDLDLASATLPISPLNTGSERKIKSIKAGAEEEISFEIVALTTADSKIHKVPLTLSYQDEIGMNYTKKDVVSIIVSSKPDLSYYVDDTDILLSGTNGKATVKIVNKGSEDIKFVNIKLKDDNDFEKLSNEEIYVGNIDSDDYETADFDIYVKKKVSDLKLPMIIEYRDSINREYKDEVDLPLKLYNAKDAKKYNLIQANGITGWIVMIVIIGVGYFIYRRYKKKKKKHRK